MHDSTKALAGTIAALAALVAIAGIMAHCSIAVNSVQMSAADCAKRGGTWHPSADIAFCEEPAAHR